MSTKRKNRPTTKAPQRPSKRQLKMLQNALRELDKRHDIEWDDAVQATEKALRYGKGLDEDKEERGSETQSRRSRSSRVPASDIYTSCDWCGTSIQYGKASLAISRNVENVSRTNGNPTATATVIKSEVAITLCTECGDYLPVNDLRRMLTWQR